VSSLNILYPNPVTDGKPLNFNYNVVSTLDEVKVKIFTTSFRKIFEDDNLPKGVGAYKYSLDWNQAGLNLANGIYYVVLELKSGNQETHQIMKLLIIR
jgi:hypothetical protein